MLVSTWYVTITVHVDRTAHCPERVFTTFDMTSYQRKIETRFHAGFGKFWKVMEIENAILQDLERFGNEIIFILAIEKFWIFV